MITFTLKFSDLKWLLIPAILIAGVLNAQSYKTDEITTSTGPNMVARCLDVNNLWVKSCFAFGENAPPNPPVPQVGLDMIYSSYANHCIMYSNNGGAFACLQ